VAEQYKLNIRAEGEVRDEDGNLVPTEPFEGQTVITEEQAQRLFEALNKQQGESK